MTDLYISIGVGLLTFVFGFLGMLFQKILPETHMTSGSRDMIGAVMGLITLLLALVLGTLVGSAYGFFAIQKGNVETLGARSIQLDIALAQYGEETRPIRNGLKAAVTSAHEAIWGSGNGVDGKGMDVAGYISGIKMLNLGVASLSPKTPLQSALLPTIGVNTGIIMQTRLLMSLQLASPVSWPLLNIVVSWAMLLFFGFGVLSRLELDQSRGQFRRRLRGRERDLPEFSNSTSRSAACSESPARRSSRRSARSGIEEPSRTHRGEFVELARSRPREGAAVPLGEPFGSPPRWPSLPGLSRA